MISCCHRRPPPRILVISRKELKHLRWVNYDVAGHHHPLPRRRRVVVVRSNEIVLRALLIRQQYLLQRLHTIHWLLHAQDSYSALVTAKEGDWELVTRIIDRYLRVYLVH